MPARLGDGFGRLSRFSEDRAHEMQWAAIEGMAKERGIVRVNDAVSAVRIASQRPGGPKDTCVIPQGPPIAPENPCRACLTALATARRRGAGRQQRRWDLLYLALSGDGLRAGVAVARYVTAR